MTRPVRIVAFGFLFSLFCSPVNLLGQGPEFLSAVPVGQVNISAIDEASGRELWRRDVSETEFLLPLGVAVKGDRVVYRSTRAVVCLDAKTGRERWRSDRPSPARVQ